MGAKGIMFYNGQLSLSNNCNRIADDQLIANALNIIKENDLKTIRYDFTKLKNLLNTVYSQKDSTDFIFQNIKLWVQKPKKRKPLVFLLAGTSGTGKTFTSELIYEGLNQYGYTGLMLPMNEYSREADSWRLFGSAQGYVGSDRTPPIFQEIQKSNKIVILFDEIEKAHPTLFTNIMTLMEKGLLSNGSGEVFDFKNCILLFTSNLAMDLLLQKKKELCDEGISPDSQEYQEAMKKILKDNGLRNEICGRIDSLLVFNSLSRIDVKKIALQELRKLAKNDYGITINSIHSDILNNIANDCAGSDEGARPIRRMVGIQFEASLQNPDINKKLIYSFNSDNQLIVDNIDNIAPIESIVKECQNEEIQQPIVFTQRNQCATIRITNSAQQIDDIDELKKSIGLITVNAGNGMGEGSCFLVSADGLIFTCAHCVPQNQVFSIRLDNCGYQNEDIDIIYKNEELDIAILKMRGVTGLPYLNVNQTFRILKSGTKIGLLAFPLGGNLGEKVSFTEGVISKKEGIHYYHNADATHGSSGGALFDMETKTVYGILKGGYGREGVNINVAVDLVGLYRKSDLEIEFY